jgi:hypothetical protein
MTELSARNFFFSTERGVNPPRVPATFHTPGTALRLWLQCDWRTDEAGLYVIETVGSYEDGSPVTFLADDRPVQREVLTVRFERDLPLREGRHILLRLEQPGRLRFQRFVEDALMASTVFEVEDGRRE